MPLYDYQCTSCGAVEEVRHGFGQEHQGACSACGGPLRRRMSATGIVFKGSGFYVTDSRKKSEGSSTSSSSTSESKPAKSDAKPASDAA